MFIPGRCGKFVKQRRRKKAAAGWGNATAGDSRQKPREHPKLRRVRRRVTYGRAIRKGGFAMTRKPEKPILTAPQSSSEYDAAVAEFIRNRGVTRCPTACLV